MFFSSSENTYNIVLNSVHSSLQNKCNRWNFTILDELQIRVISSTSLVEEKHKTIVSIKRSRTKSIEEIDWLSVSFYEGVTIEKMTKEKQNKNIHIKFVCFVFVHYVWVSQPLRNFCGKANRLIAGLRSGFSGSSPKHNFMKILIFVHFIPNSAFVSEPVSWHKTSKMRLETDFERPASVVAQADGTLRYKSVWWRRQPFRLIPWIPAWSCYWNGVSFMPNSSGVVTHTEGRGGGMHHWVGEFVRNTLNVEHSRVRTHCLHQSGCTEWNSKCKETHPTQFLLKCILHSEVLRIESHLSLRVQFKKGIVHNKPCASLWSRLVCPNSQISPMSKNRRKNWIKAWRMMLTIKSLIVQTTSNHGASHLELDELCIINMQLILWCEVNRMPVYTPGTHLETLGYTFGISFRKWHCFVKAECGFKGEVTEGLGDIVYGHNPVSERCLYTVSHNFRILPNECKHIAT